MAAIFKVSIKQNIVLPPFSEVVVPGRIQGDPTHISNAIIEPENYSDQTDLLIARSLVDPSNGVVQLRIANMSDSEQIVYGSTRIAKCETFVIARGLFLDNDTGGRLHMVKDTQEEEDQKTKSTNLPNHLVDLFNSSSPSLTPDQTLQLKGLLKRHGDAFAKSKKDLGCCDLIEYKIDTGNAAPKSKTTAPG